MVLGRICHNNYFLLVVLGFEAPFGRCLWPMLCMEHWPIEGYLCISTLGMCRLLQHVTRGWMKSHHPQVMTHITYSLSPFWLSYYFKLQDVKVTFYVWGDHIFTIMTCSPFYLGFVFYLNIFVMHVNQILLFEAFLFYFWHHLVLMVRNIFQHMRKKIHIWWNYQIKYSNIAFKLKSLSLFPKIKVQT